MRAAPCYRRWLVVATLLLATTVLRAATPEDHRETRFHFARDGIVLRVSPRTPEQVAAFYEGRGFPAEMIARIAEACLLTVSLRHRRANDVVWLELDRWRFFGPDGRGITRLDRDHWNRIWARLDTPQRFRSTFGWTQLPEVRDLHFDEPVGGNIAVVAPAGDFTLEARFRTGVAGSGPELVARIERLACPGRLQRGRP